MSDQFKGFEQKTKEMFENLYSRMENRFQEISYNLKDRLIPDTEAKLKRNVFKTVLISFAAGFIAGIAIMLTGYFSGRRKK
jgi:ABC-type Fe3+ transport system permease subunit